MKLSLYILRHGQSLYQSCKIISGNRLIVGTQELGLSGVGKMQCHEIANQIKHLKFDSIYSSDLKRCVETFNLIHGKLQDKPEENKIHFTDLLREKDAGDEKMKSYRNSSYFHSDVKRENKVANGESWEEVQRRVQIFINSLVISHFQEDKLYKMPFDECTKLLHLHQQKNQDIKMSRPYIAPLLQLQLAYNYHYSSKSPINQRKLLIITHGGFISELLIYLKYRKTNAFFEEVQIPEIASHESMNNQMHARNGSVFQIDINQDQKGIGWNCEVVMRNGQGSGVIPFAGMKHYL